MHYGSRMVCRESQALGKDGKAHGKVFAESRPRQNGLLCHVKPLDPGYERKVP
ncbi:hypothetical protein ACP70R_030457 [Stipagrostis hirtigluma subsp. patula]